jgi:hypothetical protein
MTQVRLAAAAGIPVEDVIAIEAGRADRVRLGRVRRAFEEVGARARLGVWWRGATIDRLLDEAHAALVETVAGLLVRRGWRVVPELSFAEYGERGSIDVFAANDAYRAVAVCEIKSAFGSLEETNRTLDVKVRLGPKLAEHAFGWRPRLLGRLLIVPDSATTRRVVRDHQATMNAIYPARAREIRHWLRVPDRTIAGIWFLSHLGNGEGGTLEGGH